MNVQSNLHVQTWLSDIWFGRKANIRRHGEVGELGNRSTSFDHFVGSTKALTAAR